MRAARGWAAAVAATIVMLAGACGIMGGTDYSHYANAKSTCNNGNVQVTWDSGYRADNAVFNGKAKPEYEKRNKQGDWVPDKAGAHITLKVDSKKGKVSWSTAHGTRIVCMMRTTYTRKSNHEGPVSADDKTDPYSRMGERYAGEGVPFTELPPNPRGYFLTSVIIKGYTTDPKVPKYHPNEHPDHIDPNFGR